MTLINTFRSYICYIFSWKFLGALEREFRNFIITLLKSIWYTRAVVRWERFFFLNYKTGLHENILVNTCKRMGLL